LSALFQHAAFVAVVAGFSAVLTLLLVRHLRILDVPNERSSHSIPTPRGGGLAIVGGFLLGISLIHLLGDVTPIRTAFFAGFLVALLLIAAVSFFDDFRPSGVSVKMATQLIAIGIVMATGTVIDELHLPWLGPTSLGWSAYPLTLLWILGLTNAYNFMDGLDGIAASSAAIAGAFFSVIAYQQGSPFIYLAVLALCAASCGFLIFNWPPARIFMGDVGSTFLGFAFAVMAVMAARYDHSQTSLFVVPLLLFHFIFDTVFTFARRYLRGENVLQAHRTHLYQLLNRSGYSHRTVSLIYSGMGVLQGLGAIWMVNIPGGQRMLVFLPFLLMQTVYAIGVVRMAKRHNLL
jgi:UDP-GlcNAc:undecaprenyl-phosphate GlcNAc-1-phosphate transferase